VISDVVGVKKKAAREGGLFFEYVISYTEGWKSFSENEAGFIGAYITGFYF